MSRNWGGGGESIPDRGNSVSKDSIGGRRMVQRRNWKSSVAVVLGTMRKWLWMWWGGRQTLPGLGGCITNLGPYPKNQEKDFKLSDNPSCILKRFWMLGSEWIRQRLEGIWAAQVRGYCKSREVMMVAWTLCNHSKYKANWARIPVLGVSQLGEKDFKTNML